MRTFSDYLLSKDFSTATIKRHEETLVLFSTWCEAEQLEVNDVGYSDILYYIKYLKTNSLKQSSIQLYVASLTHYFNWLVARDYRTTLPTQGIEMQNVQRKKLYHILPMLLLERVYEQIQGNDRFLSGTFHVKHKNLHYSHKSKKVMFGLMIWQGLGTRELEALQLQDVKLREGTIYVAGSRRSNERTLKLESVQVLDLMEYLTEIRPYYLQSSKAPKDNFFLTENGSKINYNSLTVLLQIVHSIEKQITNAQQIRASVITHWLKHQNLRRVQYMAGHRYVSSTESYLVNDMEGLLDDINKFHPLG